MKTVMLSNQSLKRLYFALLTIIFYSCSYPYFNQPQPVDSKNLKKIPKELQGTWVYLDMDTIFINDDSFKIIGHGDDLKIAKSMGDESLDFKYVNNKVVYVGGINFYGSIWDCELVNDTFYLNGRYVETVCLSDSVLFRKANNLYICNIKRGEWWEIITLSTEMNGEINIYYMNASDWKENQKKLNIEFVKEKIFNVSEFNSDPDTILYFKAAFKKDFFISNIQNENLFALRFVLHNDSTFEDKMREMH